MCFLSSLFLLLLLLLLPLLLLLVFVHAGFEPLRRQYKEVGGGYKAAAAANIYFMRCT